MASGVNGWCRLPVPEKRLKEEVEKYFDRCVQEEVPPTPSGLALALGVRTSTLSDRRLSQEQRSVIARAMQRIEANTMEMLLTRGGVKGIEGVLERVEELSEEEKMRQRVRALSDEEILKRLKLLSAKISEAIGKE